MTDLIKNIQRIARTKELKELIENLITDEDLPENGRIDGTTFTAFETSNRGVGGGASAEENGSLEEENQDTDAANEENNTDGSLDEATGDDFADGEIGIGDKADFISDLEDCSTGEKLEVITTDNYIPPNIADLEGYTASDWDDGNDPRESQWRSGVYYEFTVLTLHNASNPYSAVEAGLPEYDSNDPPNAPHTLVSIEEYNVDTEPDGATLIATLNRTSGEFTANVIIRKTGCNIGVDPYCPSEKPVNDWPSDGAHQVKWDGGRFVTSPYEPLIDQHAPWQNSPSKITACSSEGDQLTLQGSNDGNLLITADTGDAAGNTYVINNEGIVTDILTGSIDQLLPK